MSPDEIMGQLETFCRELTEHVDAVQVVATRSEDGRTDIFAFGSGNYYARIGACREFVERDTGTTLARAFIQEERRDSGDGPPFGVAT